MKPLFWNILIRKSDRLKWRKLVWVFLILTTIGCNSGTNMVVHKSIKEGAFPIAVAVLPFTFENKIKDGKLPSQILREAFFNHFSYLGYSDLELMEVDRRLKQSGYEDASSWSSLGTDELRQWLGADAVVRGHVLDANNFTGGFYAETWIHAKIEMTDLRTGAPIWETRHEEVDQSSIVSPTVISTIQQQLENADVNQAYGKVADQFALMVVQEIPDPAARRVKEIHLPTIQSIETDLNAGEHMKPGERFQVQMVGTPGMKGSFDIGNWKTDVPMMETGPGIYQGVYNVKEADQVENALVIGRLMDHVGLSRKMVSQGRLTIENPFVRNQGVRIESK